MAGRPVRDPLTLVVRLRIAAVITLAAGALFLSIEARLEPDMMPRLLVIHGLNTVLATFLLVSSYTSWGARHADRVSIIGIVGFVSNVMLYLAWVPSAPALAANTLTCLLVTTVILFFWSPRRVVLLSQAVCASYAVLVTTLTPLRGTPLLQSVVALGVGAALAVICAKLLERYRDDLAKREAALGALSERLMSMHEEDRRKLSRELHDGIGQSLTALVSYFWLIERQLPADMVALRADGAEMRRLTAKTLGDVRELSQILRPSALDDYGLMPSLDAHLKAFAARHRIIASFAADGLPERLPPPVETALYRITQEALANVARHARASRVQVTLGCSGDELRLEVADDGAGFPALPESPNGRSGIGLIGVRERVRALGGTIALSSRHGARLTVVLPLPR